jgi:NifU-like protein involved in Fe-S cluster formation
MNAPLYTTEILRLAAALPAPETLKRSDGQAERRSPTCGSRVSTTVAIDAEGRVEALSQEVHACAFGQAAAALVAREAIGRNRQDIERALFSLADWLRGLGDAVEWLGAEALAPARSRPSRHEAILLPLRALAAAMQEPKA